MMSHRAFILACAFATLLGGCVAPETQPKEAAPERDATDLKTLSKSEADMVFAAVKAEHLKYGTEAKFDQRVRESRISIQKCRERYIVYFGPKSWDGLDGGTQETVDRETFQINHSYYLPIKCGHLYFYQEGRKPWLAFQ